MAYRYNYYIKNWNIKKMTISVDEKYKTFRQNELYFYDGIINKEIKNNIYGKNIHGFYWEQGPDFSLDIPCLTISADGIESHGLPALVKVRYIDDDKGAILCPLEYCRHFGELRYLDSKDIHWNDKKSGFIWRGASTGISDYGSQPHEWKNLRMMFCYKYKDIYDVGISLNVFDHWPTSYIKPNVSIEDLLKYKYQVSIPGNDKDSGLNWKLASNSVVLMAKPKIESWMMEGLLQPYVHYVPLKDDYSDLTDMLEWCKNNDGKCQEIVKNAKTFMKQFDNFDVEKQLFNMIKKFYKNKFDFV